MCLEESNILQKGERYDFKCDNERILGKKIKAHTHDMLKEFCQASLSYQQKLYSLYSRRAELFRHVPKFWCKTLRSHSALTQYFMDYDTVQAMNSCVNIEFSFIENNPLSLKATFEFSKNLYFTNETLEISYIRSLKGKPRFLEATQIHWKDKMNILSAISKANTILKEKENKRTLHDASQKFDEKSHLKSTRLHSFFELFYPDTEDPYVITIIKEDLLKDPMKFYFAVQPKDIATTNSLGANTFRTEGMDVDSERGKKLNKPLKEVDTSSHPITEEILKINKTKSTKNLKKSDDEDNSTDVLCGKDDTSDIFDED